MSQFILVTTDEGLRMAATITDILLITEPSEEMKVKNNVKPDTRGVIIYKTGSKIFVKESFDILMEKIDESSWR